MRIRLNGKHCVIAGTLAAGFGLSAVGLAHAQSYPGKPILLILPLGAGTGSDVAFRLLAEKLSVSLGQQVVVENQPGASGIIGAQRVAKAAPEGYVLGGFNNAIMAILPNIQPAAGYDPLRSFEPISMVAAIPTALLVHPSLPVGSVSDLIALARSKPRQLNYATGGVGSPQHIAAAMLESMAGIQLTHVPYKGAAQATLDLAAGQVHLLFVGLGGTPLSLIRAGRLRALAFTGSQRNAILPELPTMQEAGIAGFDFSSWNALFAPANTPKDILARLNADTLAALKAPEVRARITEQVMDPLGTSPQRVTEIVRADSARMLKVIKDNNIHAE
jgi:tripartite-type tricarboxylate transporter receptor subunit TctC